MHLFKAFLCQFLTQIYPFAYQKWPDATEYGGYNFFWIVLYMDH